MKLNDTIAAIATPRGVGGIAIIRISGEDAVSSADKISVPYGTDSLFKIEDRKLTLCKIYTDDEKRLLIDEALVAVMYAPRSYTGETVVEINCHGGYYAAEKILSCLLHSGVRLAEAGEFTRRAFINGKTDLVGAEAIIDLMDASSDLGLHNAALSVTGALSEKIGAIRENILSLAAHISAAADYPEEVDAPEANEVISTLSGIQKSIEQLISGYDTGRILRDGVKTVIVGRPNVGKSSVLNAILKFDRAIVTDIPGTTRDTVEEFVNIGALTLRLIDTAGIRNASDEVEKIGVEKSVQSIENADLCIFVVDSSEGLTYEDGVIADYLTGRRVILVLNKTDKDSVLCEMDVTDRLNITPSATVLTATPKSGESDGIDRLEAAICEIFSGGQIDTDSVYLSNERQRDALYKAADAIKSASCDFACGGPFDLLYIGLEDALSALGEVTGETVREEICNTVFDRFCVGK